MRVWTSYYAHVSRHYDGKALVSISTQMPSWFTYPVLRLPELYPGWDLVNAYKSGKIDNEEYVQIYKEKLSKLNKEDILAKLESYSEEFGGVDVVMMCFEKPNDFCHRHLVAEWLGDVEELK